MALKNVSISACHELKRLISYVVYDIPLIIENFNVAIAFRLSLKYYHSVSTVLVVAAVEFNLILKVLKI